MGQGPSLCPKICKVFINQVSSNVGHTQWDAKCVCVCVCLWERQNVQGDNRGRVKEMHVGGRQYNISILILIKYLSIRLPWTCTTNSKDYFKKPLVLALYQIMRNPDNSLLTLGLSLFEWVQVHCGMIIKRECDECLITPYPREEMSFCFLAS